MVLIVVGGPFVYINFIKDDAPERLTFEDATPRRWRSSTAGSSRRPRPATAGSGASSTSSAAPTTSAGRRRTSAPSSGGLLGGTWSVTQQGTEVGYRVKEVLFGQSTEAVGRTSGVTGQMVVDGTTVQSATFTVDMTTVASDEGRRDNQFNGRIMDTSTFPTSTLTLTQPIELGSVPADLAEVTKAATARPDAARHDQIGHVRPQGPPQRRQHRGQRLDPDHLRRLRASPTRRLPGITTEDHGELEFLDRVQPGLTG